MLSKPQLHNHYIIQVQYHPADDLVQDEYRVVGVIVFGQSRKYTLNDKKEPNCREALKDPLPKLVLSWNEPATITYTYDVRWTVRRHWPRMRPRAC
jgi:hypothetical protein